MNNPRTTLLSYSEGNLTGLNHTNNEDSIEFAFTYDKDKLVNIKKESNTIEEHEHTDTTLDSYYPTQTGKLYSLLSDFDKYGRLTKIDGLVENVYDVKLEDSTSVDSAPQRANASALLTTSKDLTNNQESKYQYSNQDQLVKEQIKNSSGTVISEETFEYDAANRVTKDRLVYNGNNPKVFESVILYDEEATDPTADGRVKRYSCYLNGATSPIAQTGTYYDDFKRVTTKFCSIGGKEFKKSITYNKTRPRQLLEMIDGRPISNINYEYDAMGRIKKSNNTEYTYDEYGQLTKEQTLDKTTEYEYNGIGNIVSVTKNGAITTFGYDTTNPDRLTSYKNKAITYNANGGVASYDGYNYTWSNGKLSSIRKVLENSSRAILPALPSSQTYSFGYNGLGQRVSSSYNYINNGNAQVMLGELTSYNKKFSYDHSGRLIHETVSKTFYGEGTSYAELVYLYDESGIVGVQYTNGVNTNAYYYLRNLQGDVIAIYDTNGVEVVSYSYDAWGNCTINSTTTDYDLAHDNPIRYRDY